MTEEIDDIFNDIAREISADDHIRLNAEYDYLLSFSFKSEFEKKQSQQLVRRLFCLLPGTVYETGNTFTSRELSHDYDSELRKIIYKKKYSVAEIVKQEKDQYLYFAFNVAAPDYKWINSIHTLFKPTADDLGFSYDIRGIDISDAYLMKDDYYKFGIFDWRYIADQQDKELRRKIAYTGALKKTADAIARTMISHKLGNIIVEGMLKEPPSLKRFYFSYVLDTINIPMTYFTTRCYKEEVLVSDYVVKSLAQQNPTAKTNAAGLRIEFIQIYESDERYIFVALDKPDLPRDFKDEYNYNYLYYIFMIDKGNYLTSRIKLRQTLVNIFGETSGLSIEEEMTSQQPQKI